MSKAKWVPIRAVMWRKFTIDDIASTLADFDKARHVEPGRVIGPLTHTERQILAERIFERIFKEE